MPPSLSRRTFLAGAVLAPTTALLGCGGGGRSVTSVITGDRNIVRQWNDMALQAVRVVKPSGSRRMG